MRTQSKIYPLVFSFQVNILLLDNEFSHCLFLTDYVTVAEIVDIVAKYSLADSGVDLDLRCIEHVLTDYDSQHIQEQEST